MNNTIVFMFAGQGSQYYKMGVRLMDEDHTFNYWMRKLDVIASDLTGESILGQVYGQKINGTSFNRLLFTHPAIYMIEFALSQSLISAGITPKCVLGMSLGEYAAFSLAGSLTYENALINIVAQARLIEENCEKGGMIAVLDNINQHREQIEQTECDLVAVNTECHYVLSSSVDNLSKYEDYLDRNQIVYQRLPVEYAFHSRMLDPIEKLLKDQVINIEVGDPEVPIVSSVYGETFCDPTNLHFWDVYRQPIRFRKAFQYLKELHDCTFIDLSPGSTLANYAKRNLSIDSASTIYPIMTPFDADTKNLNKVKNAIK